MSRESSQVSGDELGVLTRCLVDGDPEQQTRQRKIRRRALILSVALQGLVIAAIVLLPLFGKPARIALANVTPLPPYYSPPAPRPAPDVQPQPRRPDSTCRFCAPRSISPVIVLHDPPRADDGQGEPRFDGIEIPGAMAPPPMPDPSRHRRHRGPKSRDRASYT